MKGGAAWRGKIVVNVQESLIHGAGSGEFFNKIDGSKRRTSGKALNLNNNALFRGVLTTVAGCAGV